MKLVENFSSNIKHQAELLYKFLKVFIKWLFFGVLIGSICGVLGTCFVKLLEYVTNFRMQNHFIYLLLPIGGIISVAIYKIFKTSDIGTNQVFESVRTAKEVPVLLAPAIFLGTIITHLFGGSAGREGAALQLGGSISTTIAKIFKLDNRERHILTLCGMAAFFSAIFGTPTGAAIFALEVVSVGQFCSAAIFPAMISSFTAFFSASALGIHPERFTVSIIPGITFGTFVKTLIISVVAAIVSSLFCRTMHLFEHGFKKVFKNEYLRITIGALAIVALTFVVGSFDYNGGGIVVINNIFTNGTVKPEAFILKILFTAITIGCGFKGGEIVPTFFIGATLGAALALILNLPTGFAAAIGMASMFCGVTNCPIASIVLAVELFSGDMLLFVAPAVAVSFLLSGYTSLYTGQKLFFSKFNDEIINRSAE